MYSDYQENNNVYWFLIQSMYLRIWFLASTVTESATGHSIIILDQLLPGNRVCGKISEFQGSWAHSCTTFAEKWVPCFILFEEGLLAQISNFTFFMFLNCYLLMYRRAFLPLITFAYFQINWRFIYYVKYIFL